MALTILTSPFAGEVRTSMERLVAADERARDLFLRCLNPKQLKDFQQHDAFHVVGSQTGKTYRIVVVQLSYVVVQVWRKGKKPKWTEVIAPGSWGPFCVRAWGIAPRGPRFYASGCNCDHCRQLQDAPPVEWGYAEIPVYDQALAFKLVIEADESAFLKRAVPRWSTETTRWWMD